jgi:hypothetical protein
MTSTEIPSAYGQFGQALAFAERTLSAILREHLAERGVAPETWYTLKLVAQGGAGLSRAALISDLELSRDVDSPVPELLARLEAEGVISDGDPVSLTAEGQAMFTSLREYVTAPTIRLLGQFDVRDIETTVRTVQAITKRAAEEQAASAQ